MATISENLQIIKDSTNAIKQAIIDKGGNVSGDITTWADAISEISGSGGGDLGDWEYYDCQNFTEDLVTYICFLSARLKKANVKDEVISKVQIGCLGFLSPSYDYDTIVAFAVDFSQPCIDANGTRTLREEIASNPDTELAQVVGMLQSFPRLTKEQFYSFE